MKTIKKTKTISKKIIIIVIALLIICSIGFYAVYITTKQDTPNKTTGTSSSSPDKSTSVDTTEKPKTEDSSTINTSNNVSVVIVDASRYNDIFEVRAYAADVVESGVCTFSFKSSTNNITKTSNATAGSSTSSCASLDIQVSELSASKIWALTVSYSSTSGSYKGESSKTINLE